MEYQKSMAPSQEQQDRLNELRTAFEGTGGYKDYRIQQMEQQMQRAATPNGNGSWWYAPDWNGNVWRVSATTPAPIWLQSRCQSRVVDITNITESRCSSQTLCSSLTRTTMGVMVCSRPRSSNIKCRSHNISRIKIRISSSNRSRNNSVVMEWVKAWVDMAVTAVCRTRISHSSLVNKV